MIKYFLSIILLFIIEVGNVYALDIWCVKARGNCEVGSYATDYEQSLQQSSCNNGTVWYLDEVALLSETEAIGGCFIVDSGIRNRNAYAFLIDSCPPEINQDAPFDSVDSSNGVCSCSDPSYEALNLPNAATPQVGCFLKPLDGDEDHSKNEGCGGSNTQNNTPHPCNVATGNKFRTETDFSNGELSFTRYYNSLSLVDNGVGTGWRHDYQPSLFIGTAQLRVTSRSGRSERWRKTGGVWVGDQDSDLIVTETASGYTLRLANDAFEAYDLNGLLQSQTDSNGQQRVYQYDNDNNLSQVTNEYGQSISFSYNNGVLTSVTDAFGAVYLYEYDGNTNLTAVVYPDTTPGDDTDNPRKIYHYENTSYPNHLTGITDENGDRYGNFAYDDEGRAMLSELGVTTNPVGQEKVELDYLELDVNIALNKLTEQSTTSLDRVSSRAVDGNVDGNFAVNSTTHTLSETQPWWQVDLGSQSVIGSVVIHNRADCCEDRLSDFYVFVSDTPFADQSLSELIANSSVDSVYHTGTLTSSSVELALPSQGRYVRVQLTGSNILSLAEVQVIGSEEN